MKPKKIAWIIIIVALIAYVAIEIELAYPTVETQDKPVILYYNTFNLPFSASEFPKLIDFVQSNHFNTLMLLVYGYGHALFNPGEISYFANYSVSHGVTFVPSYYIVSLQDQINTTGFRWVNLDMELLKQNQQPFFYYRVASSVPFVSVTSPYGVPILFQPGMSIVETYYDTPSFWFMQLWFPHSDVVCSVSAHSARTQVAFDSEFDYCLAHSRGVMVFDYWNMQRANYTTPLFHGSS